MYEFLSFYVMSKAMEHEIAMFCVGAPSLFTIGMEIPNFKKCP